MEDTLVFIDGGFLSKLARYFGDGKYLKYKIAKLAEIISKKENLFCRQIFYYTAPPFQSEFPTQEEIIRKEGYDKFIGDLKKSKRIVVRGGRVQRLKIDGKYFYKQKGVDTLMIIDLCHIVTDFSDVKRIIILTSDTDFCPVIIDNKKRGISTILGTYFDRKRDSSFSLSNELLNCCSKYIQLTKEDFFNSNA